MHPLRKQRLQLVLLILTATTVVVGLVLYYCVKTAIIFTRPRRLFPAKHHRMCFCEQAGWLSMAVW